MKTRDRGADGIEVLVDDEGRADATGQPDLAAIRTAVEAALAGGAHRVEIRLPAQDRALVHQVGRAAGMRKEGTLRGVLVDGRPTELTVLSRVPGDPEPLTREAFLGLLNTTMPTTRCIAQGVLRDERGRLLLCQLTYKQEWDMPGGIVDPGEPPSTTLTREIDEELAMHLPPRDLLAVNWLPPYRGWSDALLFVFDLGTVDSAWIDEVRTHPREIVAVHWADEATVRARCAPYVVRLLERLDADARAGWSGGPRYLIDGALAG